MSTARAAKAAPVETANAVFQDATAKVESLVAESQKNLTEQFEKFSKGFEGFTAFGQENVDPTATLHGYIAKLHRDLPRVSRPKTAGIPAYRRAGYDWFARGSAAARRLVPEALPDAIRLRSQSRRF